MSRLAGVCARLAIALLLLIPTLHPAGALAAKSCAASAPVPDDATARTVFAEQRPFQPTDRDYFLSFDNPDWVGSAPPVYPTGPAPTEQETHAALKAFLAKRFPCSPKSVQYGLGVYDNPLAIQKIPDPTLRAALAALTGTLGEPAIGFLLRVAPVSSIHFGVVLTYGEGFPTGHSASVYGVPDGTWVIVFDSRFRYLPFASLSALVFHEALHIEPPEAGIDPNDGHMGAGLPEEATAVALESLVYMEMLLTDPTLASLPDPLTRGANNRAVLDRLNSGPAGSDRLTIFLPDNDQNIDPTTTQPLTEFYSYYAGTDLYAGTDVDAWSKLETHGNALLRAVLPALAEPGHAPPDHADFDRATLDYLDANQALFSPGQLLAVACILRLNVPCDGTGSG